VDPFLIAVVVVSVVSLMVILVTTALNLRTFRRTGSINARAVRFNAVYMGGVTLVFALAIGAIIIYRGLWPLLLGVVPIIVVAVALMRARPAPPPN
jgi:hypothetical protein